MERSHGLDIIRAVAILLVMIGHGADIIYPYLGEFIGNVIHQQFGPLGVQLFFILSGYLVGRILIKTYLEREFNSKAIGYFWLRRWFRTVPNYFLFLVIYICIGIWYNTKVGHWNFDLSQARPLYLYPFFLQNFLTPVNGFFSQSWSLTIEEWFYISLPLFFLLGKRFTGRNVSPTVLILLFIVLNWGIKTFVHLYAPDVVGSSVIYGLDNIIYGVLMVSITMQYASFVRKHHKTLCCLGLFLFSIAELLHLKGILPMYPFFSIVSALFLALTIPYAETIVLKNRILERTVTTISKASYTIYLSNFFIVVFIIEGYLVHLFPVTGAGIAFLIFGIYMVANILVAYVHYRAFEVPVMNLRDKSWIRGYFENGSLPLNTGRRGVGVLIPEPVTLKEEDPAKNRNTEIK